MSDYSIKLPLMLGAKITVVHRESTSDGVFGSAWAAHVEPSNELTAAFFSHVKPSRLLPGVSRFVYLLSDGRRVFDPKRRYRYGGVLNLHDEGSTWARGWERDGETEALAELRACRALAELAEP